MRRVVPTVVLAMVAIACGSDGGTLGSTPDTTTASSGGEVGGPASIAITRDDSAAVSSEIGPAGGELVATSATGVVFTLTVPAGALLAPVTITMTPITAATGDVIEGAPVAAVHLAPEGLHFIRPVTITAAGAGIPEPAGIGADGVGADLHMIPADVSDGVLRLTTMHFSLVGFSAWDQVDDAFDSYQPHAAEYEAITAVARAGHDFTTAYAALATWAEVVHTTLTGARTTEELESVTVDMLSLLYRIGDTLTLQEEVEGTSAVPPELEEAFWSIVDVWYEMVDADVVHLGGMCRSDPASAFRVYRWALIAAAVSDLVGDDITNLLDAWMAQAGGCLTFEVDWDTSVELVDSVGESAFTLARASATVTGPVRFDADLLEITGEFAVVEAEYSVGQFIFEGCTPVVTAGVAIVGLQLDVTLDNPPSAAEVEIAEFVVGVDGEDPPRIECQEAIDVDYAQDWAGWFFVLPLSLINADRVIAEGAWIYRVPVTGESATGGLLELTASDTRSGTTATVMQDVVVTHVGS